MSSTVGRLAFIVVGTVIGAFFGAPQLGFALGSAIGGLVFAPEGPKVEGPRIGDTEIQSSALGVTIPLHFGTTRSAPQILWSGGLKERRQVEKQGKGGGGGSSTTYTYSSSFMCVFGFGPAVALRRMWADGKIIYDSTGSSKDVKNKKYKFTLYKGDGTNKIDPLIDESINRRFGGLPDINEGSGAQQTYTTMADLLAQAQTECGAGSNRACVLADALRARMFGQAGFVDMNEVPQYNWYTNQNTTNTTGFGWLSDDETPNQQTIVPDYRFTPAYKDLCFIVFDDMALEDFGNRIPNITAEIVWETTDQILGLTGTVSETIITELSPVITAPTSLHGFDLLTKQLIALSGTTLRKFDYATNAENNYVVDPLIDKVIGTDSAGNPILNLNTPNAVGRLEPLTLVTDGSVGSAQGNYTAPTYGAALYDGQTADVRLFAVINASGNLGIIRTDSSTMDLVWGDTVADSSGALDDVLMIGVGPMTAGGTSGQDGTGNGSYARAYVLVDSGAGLLWELKCITCSYSIVSGVLQHNVNVVDVASGSLLAAQSIANVVFDISTSRILCFFNTAGGGCEIRKYSPAGTLEFTSTSTVQAPGPESGFQKSSTGSRRIAWIGTDDLAEMDVLTGDITESNNILTAGSASAVAQVYIGTSDVLLTWNSDVPYLVGLNRSGDIVSIGSTELRSITASLCARAGMVAGDYDTTGIDAANKVYGFSIARPSSVRQILEKLFIPFLTDGIETDWQIKFSDRKTAPARTILEKDLGIISGPTGDINWRETRAPDHTIPQEINITYIEYMRDYQKGAARATRVSNPITTMFSNTKENIEIPLAMTEADAQAAAERLLYLSWLSRDSSRVKLSWEHLDLDPADLVTFSFSDRNTVDRIGKAEMGADFTLEMDLTRAGDPVHTITSALSVGSNSIPKQLILTPVPTRLFVMDLPLLYDFQDKGRVASSIYITAGAEGQGWSGAQVFMASDGINFNGLFSTSFNATWGAVAGIPPAPRSLWTTDTETQLTVFLGVDNGDIVSITREEQINTNANRAILYNPTTRLGEIIQYKDAVQNPNGSYTLTNIVRGLRGTDYASRRHTSGTFFILIKDSASFQLEHEFGALGSTRYFKGVSTGSILNSSPTQSLVLAGAPLKPWGPNNFKRSDDGSDLTVTWTRRTRVGGAWNMVGSGIETVPLNEDTEAYEFYLLPLGTETVFDAFDPNDSATYVLKKSITTPTVTVTAAELTAASQALTDRFNVVVYQVSAQVGIGFPGEGALAQ